MTTLELQWLVLVLFGLVFFWLAPHSKTKEEFFSAQDKSKGEPSFWLLTGSLVISWIFAKSITNAANLGLAFGLVGGIAYACYYFSFWVGGAVIYKLRTAGSFKSIHHFLGSTYGKSAILVFTLLIAFRLFNEVWSNTMVIGTYFGDSGSRAYIIAIIVFTLLTLAYTLKGGLRSSLVTDAIQLAFFGVLLFVLLVYLLPKANSGGGGQELLSSSWTFAGGINLLLAAMIQSFSYPFHDPVMTDRGFITNPKTTLRSFVWAGIIGFALILLFSMIGMYARKEGLEGQAAVEVAKLIGVWGMLVMNVIMVSSAASTLDSTFSSFSKLMVVDLGIFKGARYNWSLVTYGRLMMGAIVVLGTVPIFFGPEILSATTLSGTMVIGLAPPFIFWKRGRGSWGFLLPVLAGLVVGILLVLNRFPEQLIFTEGKYAALLWSNLWGSVLVFVLFAIGVAIDGSNGRKQKLKTSAC